MKRWSRNISLNCANLKKNSSSKTIPLSNRLKIRMKRLSACKTKFTRNLQWSQVYKPKLPNMKNKFMPKDKNRMISRLRSSIYPMTMNNSGPRLINSRSILMKFLINRSKRRKDCMSFQARTITLKLDWKWSKRKRMRNWTFWIMIGPISMTVCAKSMNKDLNWLKNREIILRNWQKKRINNNLSWAIKSEH